MPRVERIAPLQERTEALHEQIGSHPDAPGEVLPDADDALWEETLAPLLSGRIIVGWISGHEPSPRGREPWLGVSLRLAGAEALHLEITSVEDRAPDPEGVP